MLQNYDKKASKLQRFKKSCWKHNDSAVKLKFMYHQPRFLGLQFWCHHQSRDLRAAAWRICVVQNERDVVETIHTQVSFLNCCWTSLKNFVDVKIMDEKRTAKKLEFDQMQRAPCRSRSHSPSFGVSKCRHHSWWNFAWGRRSTVFLKCFCYFLRLKTENMYVDRLAKCLAFY